MLDVRKFRSSPKIVSVLSWLLALCILAIAQDKGRDNDKDRDKEKESKKGNTNFVKVEGKVRCDRPDTEHSIEVPDRPGHVLMIAKRKCTWEEPMLIIGAKTKDGVAVGFTEKMEGALHTHTFEVDTLDSGEKITMHTNGQILSEKGPAPAKGRWNFMRGTGKFKGIKGAGDYEGQLGADGALTLEFEGVYDPSETAAGKNIERKK
jgi:hypothetical protein